MRYKAQASFRGKLTESEPCTEAQAYNTALAWKRDGKFTTITITQDSEGADHPSNAGKFFLHRIIK